MTHSKDQHPVGSGHRTWHMTPHVVWESESKGETYQPEQFRSEGFIHCTDSLDELVAVGNRFYRGDLRAFLALEIDCDRVNAPVVYEDHARIFPHIYGNLPVFAVVRIRVMVRDHAGMFVSTTEDPHRQ